MIKVLFVCHGNICRSPMAEFVLKKLTKDAGKEKEFFISSAAVSAEEIGNPVHPGTREILSKLGISPEGKRAVQLTKRDYFLYDYLIGMDQENIRGMLRIFGKDPNNKIRKLLDFTEEQRDIKDPWYTHNFEQTYEDIVKGCKGLLEELNILEQ